MIPISDHNPTHRTPYVTVAILAACVLVYLWQASLDPRAAQAAVLGLGFIPALLLSDASLAPDLVIVPAPLTLVTSMFLHGDLMHLAGNLLYLWVFGNNIEDATGHGRFILFYVLCGLAAAAAQALPDPGSQIPMIGASGAISGVLGAYLMLFPHARVNVLIPFGLFLHTVKAGWLLGFWFLFQVVSGVVADSSGGGVAWWAHVGGFVTGIGLIFILRDPGFRPRRATGGRSPGRSRIPRSGRRRSGPWG